MYFSLNDYYLVSLISYFLMELVPDYSSIPFVKIFISFYILNSQPDLSNRCHPLFLLSNPMLAVHLRLFFLKKNTNWLSSYHSCLRNFSFHFFTLQSLHSIVKLTKISFLAFLHSIIIACSECHLDLFFYELLENVF